jgi:hypothetical protein
MARRIAKNGLLATPSIGDSISSNRADGGWILHWLNDKTGHTDKKPLIPWRALLVGSILFGAITLAGAVCLLVRRQWFPPLYIAATIALICLTPWPEQYLRYLTSVSPFLALSFVTALIAARKYFAARPQRPLRVAGTRAAIILLSLAPVMEAFGIACIYKTGFRAPLEPGKPNLFYVSDAWGGWSEAMRWVDANAGPDEVIVTANPHLLYLSTGRKAVMPPMEIDTAKALKYLDSVPVRYMIVGDFRFLNVDLRYAGPAVYKNQSAWKLVFTSSDKKTRVWERVR